MEDWPDDCWVEVEEEYEDWRNGSIIRHWTAIQRCDIKKISNIEEYCSVCNRTIVAGWRIKEERKL